MKKLNKLQKTLLIKQSGLFLLLLSFSVGAVILVVRFINSSNSSTSTDNKNLLSKLGIKKDTQGATSATTLTEKSVTQPVQTQPVYYSNPTVITPPATNEYLKPTSNGQLVFQTTKLPLPLVPTNIVIEINGIPSTNKAVEGVSGEFTITTGGLITFDNTSVNYEPFDTNDVINVINS